MVRFEDVQKILTGKTVIHSFSLELPAHQTHVLIGPSGCGKSTLLRMLAGLIEPSAGRVLIGDQKITRQSQREIACEIGYVIQEGGLFPHLTAAQNVGLAARVQKWQADKIDKRISELAELVGFKREILGRYPKQLSGGQRQRVSLMRSLMLDPPTLLLDEPLGALDPVVRAGLQEELKGVFDKLNKTVVMVTHDISEAVFFGHSITLIRQGRILQHGTAEDLYRHPKDPFVTEFINAQRPPALVREFLL